MNRREWKGKKIFETQLNLQIKANAFIANPRVMCSLLIYVLAQAPLAEWIS